MLRQGGRVMRFCMIFFSIHSVLVDRNPVSYLAYGIMDKGKEDNIPLIQNGTSGSIGV